MVRFDAVLEDAAEFFWSSVECTFNVTSCNAGGNREEHRTSACRGSLFFNIDATHHRDGERRGCQAEKEESE